MSGGESAVATRWEESFFCLLGGCKNRGSAMNASNPLVVVQELKKYFPVTRGLILQRRVGFVRAVDGVSFTIQAGETLGMVGESGCGKTTVGRTMLGLYPATSGSVVIDGDDILHSR